MRWKYLRRRLSISAPRMIVRSYLPWPLRWIAFALMLGFSAAIGLWAFEFGKDIAGLDRNAKAELSALRVEVEQLRAERQGPSPLPTRPKACCARKKSLRNGWSSNSSKWKRRTWV